MNWQNFIEAFTEALCTEFYGEKYPELREIHDSRGLTHEVINEFVIEAIENEKIDPTKVLNDYIDSLLIGRRYALDGGGLEHYVVIEKILGYGGIFPGNKLIQPKYNDFHSIEDEVVDYNVRSFLIDFCGPRNLIPELNQIDWKNIEGKYWEDISDYKTDNDRYSVLKFYSNYLKTI